MKHPIAPRTDQIDTIHGVAVADPFRRLESADDPGTVEWVAEQNALTRRLLDTPLRGRLAARLRQLHRVPRMSGPALRGERLFFTENDGTRAQAVLYMTKGSGPRAQGSETAGGFDTEPGGFGLAAQVLVDPNGLSADGTTAITVFEPDDTGSRVVYGLSQHGSDRQELLIHDVAAAAALDDRLRFVKFASIAWRGDGFFYTRYPQPGTVPREDEQYFCQVWFHRVGDPQTADRLVSHRPDAPDVVFDVKVTSDDRHLVITSYRGASDHAEVHVVRLDATVRLKPDTTVTEATAPAATEAGRTEAGATQTVATETVATETGTTEAGTTEAWTTEAETIEAGATEIGTTEAGTTEARATETAATETAATETAATETAATETAATETAATETAATEAAATETGVTDARPLVTGFSSGWHFIDGRDGQLYFYTDAGAPLGRIVRFDLDDPAPAPHLVISESRDTIVDAAVANGRLLVSSLRNASSRLASWSLEGADERVIALPGIGTVSGLGARWTDARSFVTFTSFTTPPEIMACGADALAPIRQRALPFDPSAYLIEQVWYPSKDGTPISMFLVSKRRDEGRPERLTADALAAAGQACLLSGYGGFNISLTPAFDPSDFLWLDAGGMLAIANLRGGGEYGDAWHRAGMRERKQNVFDDFIAAAHWLQSTGRADRGQVAIEGGSNGGLLVGACLVQRPDLFGAAVCRVPVADMLRYHLFTVGRFWIPEYGCADEAADFPFLLRYSPYHNVIDGTAYPPTLVMTADTDDRVAPGMAKKFAARLQEAVAGTDGGPILLRVETRAGHGAGKPMEKQIDEQSDLYAFLFHYLTRTSASEQARRAAGPRT